MKKSIFVKALFVLFLIISAAAMFSHYTDTLKPSFAAEGYTYKVVPLKDVTDLEASLNQYAADGWRLVEVDGDTGNIIFEK